MKIRRLFVLWFKCLVIDTKLSFVSSRAGIIKLAEERKKINDELKKMYSYE